MLIAVIGAAQCSPDEARLAEAIGRELAGRGAVLICGGLGGVMEAACRGAAGAGGLTVGLVPGDDPSSANRYVDIAIATGVGQARNIAIVKSARAVIAVGGEFGTLSEIAFAAKAGVPVIGLNTWKLAKPGLVAPPIVEVRSALEAVERAMALALQP